MATADIDAPLPLARVLAAIGGVYVAQSLVGGLTFMGVPAVLRAEGASLAEIGLVSLLMLPWALKFLWAPLAERYRIRPDGARRSRRLVAAGQIACALLLGAVALVGPDGGQALFGLLALVALASATVDIAVDAFAVERLADANRGWGNVAQVGGGYLGMVLGGGAFLVLVPAVGWTGATGAMACLVLLLAVPFLSGAEPPLPAPATPHRPSLLYALRRPEVRLGLLVTVLFEAGVRLVQVLSGPFLVDRGLDLAALGFVNGGGGVAAGIAGTLIGGLLVRRCGARVALLVAAALQVLALLALTAGAAAEAGAELLAGLVVLKTLSMAMGFVTLYSLLMGLSSLKQAGVDFTLFQCADAATAGMAGYGAALAAGTLGYATTFAAAAVAAGIGLVLILFILRRLAAVPEPRP
ncbi:MFS transporter [Xanthobacter pseudotagetidis]|uniref:MFS transporter n=1 Tax=Xanthobacter pseudotagetidis TaxID=3119911 RepID=UPI00372B8AB3